MSTALGIGVYTLREAERLSGVSRHRLKRWIRGYTFTSADGEPRVQDAVWEREIPIEDQLLLSFRDLIEARWIDFFRKQHVAWPAIREAAVITAREFGVSHPFSTGRFAVLADGQGRGKITAANLPDEMRDVLSNQYLLASVMEPFLKQLEMRGDKVVRWFPLAGSRRVLLDPEVRFGAPIVASGVPTETLWKNHEFGGASFRALSHWWDIPEREVRDAVRWESESRAA